MPVLTGRFRGSSSEGHPETLVAVVRKKRKSDEFVQPSLLGSMLCHRLYGRSGHSCLSPGRRACTDVGAIGTFSAAGCGLWQSAIASFRQGQFPDAYGRFIRLANLGHADSARYALLMCEHGLDLFGRDWDCAPHSVESWARVAGIAARTIAARRHGNTSPPSASGRR